MKKVKNVWHFKSLKMDCNGSRFRQKHHYSLTYGKNADTFYLQCCSFVMKKVKNVWHFKSLKMDYNGSRFHQNHPYSLTYCKKLISTFFEMYEEQFDARQLLARNVRSDPIPRADFACCCCCCWLDFSHQEALLRRAII